MKSFREPTRHAFSGSRIIWALVLVSLFAALIMHYTSPRANAIQNPDGTEKVWRSAIIDLH